MRTQKELIKTSIRTSLRRLAFFILDSPADYSYLSAIIQPIRGGTVTNETSAFVLMMEVFVFLRSPEDRSCSQQVLAKREKEQLILAPLWMPINALE